MCCFGSRLSILCICMIRSLEFAIHFMTKLFLIVCKVSIFRFKCVYKLKTIDSDFLCIVSSDFP